MNMYINSLGMREISSQTVKSTDGRLAGTGAYRYDTVMQKALEKRNTAVGAAYAREGDMVITQPSSYSYQSPTVRKTLNDQERNEMSLKEYRQWFRNEVSGIQSEFYGCSPYLSDTLIIKEEAFEKMKSDPEWEKEVLARIREHCYGQETVGTKAVGYQIIGTSPENCHEEEIPVSISSLYASNPWLTSGGYWNSMLSGQSGLSGYLTQGLLSGQNSLGLLSSAAYRNVMNGGLGNSLLGNFTI